MMPKQKDIRGFIKLIVLLSFTLCFYGNSKSLNSDGDTNDEPCLKFWFVEPKEIDDIEFIYDDYKITMDDAGGEFYLEIRGCRYSIEETLDFGEKQLSVYQNNNMELFVVGLIDFYKSAYFVYTLEDNDFTRLGSFYIAQPDVEEIGFKKVTFDICQTDDRYVFKVVMDKQYSESVTLIKN